MLIVAPIAAVAATRSHRVVDGLLPQGTGSFVTGHMGRGLKTRPAESIFPMAYLVEQDPDTHLRPHFHDADQFQVIVAGSGLLGKQPLTALSLHFAAAATPYGPIEAGPEGIHYFTLRNGWDSGAKYLPESRPHLLQRNRRPRSAAAGPLAVPDEAALAAGTQATLQTAIAPAADGLAAWLICTPPGASTASPAQDAGNDQFWIVVRGKAMHAAQTLDPNSCIFVSRGEPPPGLVAGPRGLAVLVVQYPRYG